MEPNNALPTAQSQLESLQGLLAEKLVAIDQLRADVARLTREKEDLHEAIDINVKTMGVWMKRVQAAEAEAARLTVERSLIQRAICKTACGGDGSEDDDVHYTTEEIVSHIDHMDQERKEFLTRAIAAEAEAARLRAALEAVEPFIEEELECRESSFLPEPNPDEVGYIESAKAALDTVRAALADPPRTQGATTK